MKIKGIPINIFNEAGFSILKIQSRYGEKSCLRGQILLNNWQLFSTCEIVLGTHSSTLSPRSLSPALGVFRLNQTPVTTVEIVVEIDLVIISPRGHIEKINRETLFQVYMLVMTGF